MDGLGHPVSTSLEVGVVAGVIWVAQDKCHWVAVLIMVADHIPKVTKSLETGEQTMADLLDLST